MENKSKYLVNLSPYPLTSKGKLMLEASWCLSFFRIGDAFFFKEEKNRNGNFSLIIPCTWKLPYNVFPHSLTIKTTRVVWAVCGLRRKKLFFWQILVLILIFIIKMVVKKNPQQWHSVFLRATIICNSTYNTMSWWYIQYLHYVDIVDPIFPKVWGL